MGFAGVGPAPLDLPCPTAYLPYQGQCTRKKKKKKKKAVVLGVCIASEDDQRLELCPSSPLGYDMDWWSAGDVPATSQAEFDSGSDDWGDSDGGNVDDSGQESGHEDSDWGEGTGEGSLQSQKSSSEDEDSGSDSEDSKSEEHACHSHSKNSVTGSRVGAADSSASDSASDSEHSASEVVAPDPEGSGATRSEDGSSSSTWGGVVRHGESDAPNIQAVGEEGEQVCCGVEGKVPPTHCAAPDSLQEVRSSPGYCLPMEGPGGLLCH